MNDLNIIAFQKFIKFRAFRSGIKNNPLRMKGQDIVENLTLMVGGKVHYNRVNAGQWGLFGNNGYVLNTTASLTYCDDLEVMPGKASHGLI